MSPEQSIKEPMTEKKMMFGVTASEQVSMSEIGSPDKFGSPTQSVKASILEMRALFDEKIRQSCEGVPEESDEEGWKLKPIQCTEESPVMSPVKGNNYKSSTSI